MVKAVTLAELGMDSVTNPSDAQPTIHSLPSAANAVQDEAADHFIVRDGLAYAGSHLLIDLYGARNLDNMHIVETALRDCVEAAGATLLHIHLHHFTPNGGISGVAVLAESHISIHSWPERGYAALDVFMCGDAKPRKCLPVLRQAFQPDHVQLSEQLRGLTE